MNMLCDEEAYGYVPTTNLYLIFHGYVDDTQKMNLIEDNYYST